MGSVRVLDESVARKIAAGEVIDRPLSVVRELLDNAIDSGATEISCYVEGGGVRSIRVTDNGCGMSREDLSLAILPHATSKIRVEDDLLRLNTLGFRGEALASIATCTRMEILTGTGTEGWRMVVQGGSVLSQEPSSSRTGTVVEAGDLFWSMPARRKFLKRPATESQLCRKHFIEKTLPFNSITFRYFNDGKLDLFLPATDRLSRFHHAYPHDTSPEQLLEGRYELDGLKVEFVAGTPGLYRKNRNLMAIYVNRRRIEEYGLMQAIQYAYSPFLPGGLFPVCTAFLDIPPDEVDFNVHPAKKEARFKDLTHIHRFVTQSLQDLLSTHKRVPEPHDMGPESVSAELWQRERTPAFAPPPEARTSLNEYGKAEDCDSTFPSRYSEIAYVSESLERQQNQFPIQDQQLTFRYLGQIFGCFLLAEKGNELYLIDQHAAHERILFNKFVSAPPPGQPLLIPLSLQFESEEIKPLIATLDTLRKAGFHLIEEGGDHWSITAIPSVFLGNADLGIDILRQTLLSGAENLTRTLYSNMACRTAVKEGDALDNTTARNIVEQTFQLPEPRCPHGRPVWFRLTKGELEGLVGRSH